MSEPPPPEGTKLTVLWPCSADELAVERIAGALNLLNAGASAARARWPGVRGNLTGVRLICPSGAPLPDALVQAARNCGCDLFRVDAPPLVLAGQCDIALVSSADSLMDAGLLPALVLAASADDAWDLHSEPAQQLQPGVRPAHERPSPATPALIAAAALAPPRSPQESHKLSDYLAEGDDARVARHAYDLLLWLIGQKAEIAGIADTSWERAAALAQAVRPSAASAIDALRLAYSRADALALAYGKRWRSTLVARSLMLLLASACSGLIGALLPWLSVVTIPIQAAVTLLIFADSRHAQRNRWRQKWVDYRRLAESLRSRRLLALCGVAPSQTSDGDWVAWASQRAARAAVPYDALSDGAAAAVLNYLAEVEIADQIAYHRKAFRRFRRLDHRFRRAATIAMFAFIALGAILSIVALTQALSIKLSLASAVGLAFTAAPALYATINSVRRDLDVVRQAARSAEIAAALKRLAASISQFKPTAEIARAAALRAAQIMGDDLSSWRSVTQVL
jgi:hypothetical protein